MGFLSKIAQVVKKHKSAVSITLCVWILLNVSGISTRAFQVDTPTKSFPYRVLHLIFLFFLINHVTALYHHRKNPDVKRSILFSSAFLITAGGIFVCIYPGSWSWDDVFIYTSALHYDLNAWQHILTSVFHILCLETLPIAGAVPVMQILIATMICGYIPVALGSVLPSKHRTLFEVLIFLPLLSPPLLTYLYSGFRMGIIPYFEILLYAMMICHIRKQNARFSDLINLALLTVLVSSWRTENIYYIFLLIVFLVFHKRSADLRKTAVIVVFVIMCVLATGRINARLINNDNYSIMATIVPVKEMIDRNALSKEDEAVVSRVLKVGFMREYPQFSAEELYFMTNGIVREIYTKEDYNSYKKVYCKNVILHPLIVLKAAWGIFDQASGLCVIDGATMQRTVLSNTAGGADTLFDEADTHSISFLSMDIPWKRPISNTFRVKMLNVLQFRNESGRETAGYFLFWNLWIPICLNLVTVLVTIKRNDYFMTILSLAVIARFFVIFATAVAPYIMYYLSAYLISDVLFLYVFAEAIANRKTFKHVNTIPSD